ncbi:N-acetylneuraminate synthase [Pseudodesulfovibrio sp.]|nr:N-acetylneuraminate synthase [Pseudodesulfovibrio sp.]
MGVYIIAEAGVNHNGNMDLAFEMIDIAAKAGADCIKFQAYKAEELATPDASKATYQVEATGGSESQLDMLRRLEVTSDMHAELHAKCKEIGIDFLCTPFDADSADMLVERFNLPILKIPSGEIINLPYLRRLGALKKKIFMSTGMATVEEIDEALAVLEEAGTQRNMVTLLHCNTQYPTPFEDANLLALQSLSKTFPDCAIGYSDHTPGITCPIAATALRAVLVEKHFTLDRSMEGPDHLASIEPKELIAMVKAIRETEQALGTGIKKPTPSEKANINIARRFLVADTFIKKGESFTPENIAPRRTGVGGISPMCWDKIIGTSAPRDFVPGEVIEL